MQKGTLRKSLKAAKDYLYILPAVVLISVFFISSIIYTFRLSFFKWDGFNPQVFVGLENYTRLFQDTNFWVSVRNTTIWVALSLIISLILPLLLAIMIVNSSFSKTFKNIFYFPSTLSGTVAGLIMVAMLSKYGIPQLLGLLGFPSLVKDWLSIPFLNTFVMIFMGTWTGIGLSMLLFIAALRNMNRSSIEAAQIDGAGGVRLYHKIIIPQLSNTTKVVLLMSLVNSFKVFDNIWVMTKGGPFRSSETLALTVYTESFIRNDYGSGAAAAVFLTIVVVIVAYFNLRNTYKSS
jgi:ABC-type sugar transport system permease subunit